MTDTERGRGGQKGATDAGSRMARDYKKCGGRGAGNKKKRIRDTEDE